MDIGAWLRTVRVGLAARLGEARLRTSAESLMEIDGSLRAWRRRVVRGESLALLGPAPTLRREIALSLRADVAAMLANVASNGPGTHGQVKDLVSICMSLNQIGREALSLMEDVVLEGMESPDSEVASNFTGLFLEVRGWSVDAWTSALKHAAETHHSTALAIAIHTRLPPPEVRPLVEDLARSAPREYDRKLAIELLNQWPSS